MTALRGGRPGRIAKSRRDTHATKTIADGTRILNPYHSAGTRPPKHSAASR